MCIHHLYSLDEEIMLLRKLSWLEKLNIIHNKSGFIQLPLREFKHIRILRCFYVLKGSDLHIVNDTEKY